MNRLGTSPPPSIRDRSEVAAWYWDQVQSAPDAAAVEDLISGAIDAGVVGHLVPVAGFARPVQLHELLAPYRRDVAAEDRARSAFLAGAHTRAVQGRRAERGWSW